MIMGMLYCVPCRVSDYEACGGWVVYAHTRWKMGMVPSIKSSVIGL